MSLGHLDWCEVKKIDPGLGEWLITVQDDACRKVIAWGIFENPTITQGRARSRKD